VKNRDEVKGDMIHTLPMLQPDLVLLIRNKTVVYPTDEQIDAIEKNILAMYDNDMTKVPGYELNIKRPAVFKHSEL